MASLSIGAVGDIIALANILVHVIKALSATRGSAVEYQGLTNNLESLVHALESIESVANERWSKDLPLREFQEKLQLAIRNCRASLKRELDCLRKFENSLTTAGPIRSAQDTFWRLRWLGHRKEVRVFRQTISNHTSIITLLFQHYAIQLSQDNHRVLLDLIGGRPFASSAAGHDARLSQYSRVQPGSSRICVETAANYEAAEHETEEDQVEVEQPVKLKTSFEAVANLTVSTKMSIPEDASFHDRGSTSLLGKSLEQRSRLRTRSCPEFWDLMEAYTNRDPVPDIFGYHNYLAGETEYTRIFQSALFYRRGARQWMRVTACITVSIESAFWNLETADSFNPKVALVLPRYVLSVLGSFLKTRQSCEQDSHLSLFLGSQSKSPSKDSTQSPVKLIESPPKVKDYLQQISSTVRHWQCPRYSQNDLIHRPLSRRRANHSFLAQKGSRWLRKYRFGSSKQQIDTNHHMLQILHSLRGTPGIIPFQGVVLDEDGRTINAFLCDLPAGGKLANIIGDAERSNRPIRWERRKKWCRQIVQAVANMHDKGFVIGSLGETPDGAVAIDGADDAVLYPRFQKTFRYDGVRAGVVPPESRQQMTSKEGSLPACPESDIYQLGLLLWRIATQKLVLLRSECCHNVGCTQSTNVLCTEPHADPTELPLPDGDVPRYLKNAITACRIEEPDKRMTARELLDMFPRAEKEETRPKTTPKELSLEEILEMFDCTATWDRCGERTSSHFFHCEICASTDYDLCFSCFSKSHHCLEVDHMLREYREGLDEEKYYSNVKQNGRREVVIR